MASTTAATRVVSRKAQLQLFWLKIHRWIGLALLLVFAAFAITGSLLVWPDHFDRMVHPERYPADATATPVAPSVLVAAAQTALPEGDSVSAIRYPSGIIGVRVAGQVTGPAPMNLGPPSRATVWLDPVNGAVLSSVDEGGGFQWSLRALHGHLLLATGGREAVAIAGLVLLVSAGTGLWIWWPGPRNVTRALKWRRQASISMNLHRHGGAIIVVILVIEAITGIYVSVPGVFSRMFENAAVAEHSDGPPVTRSIADPHQNIDEVLASARALVPDGKTVTIFLPTQSNPRWVVTFATGEGERTVRVADTDGEARAESPHDPTTAERVEHLMADIHFGNFGPVWQIVVFLSGITLAVLSVTGGLLWLQGRARLAKRARAPV